MRRTVIARRGGGPPPPSAAGIGLLQELDQRALEVLEQQVDVEDLIGIDRSRPGRHLRRLQRLLFDRLRHRALDGEDDDEGDVAGGAGHLDRVPLLDVREHPDLAALQAPATDRAVVVAGAIADELEHAHPAAILRHSRSAGPRLAVAFDAGHSAGSDHRRMHGSGGQQEAVPGLHLDALPLVLEHEGDRAADAVEDLLVGVAVGRVAVSGAVRPAVGALRLRLEPPHQLVGLGHGPDLRIRPWGSASWPTRTWAGWRAGCGRWGTTPASSRPFRTPSWSGWRWPK